MLTTISGVVIYFNRKELKTADYACTFKGVHTTVVTCSAEGIIAPVNQAFTVALSRGY